MVNLQMHLNKPIAESSLLMPCYMSHLTQVRIFILKALFAIATKCDLICFILILTQLKCDNWHVTAPTVVSDSVGLAPFVQGLDGKLIYAGTEKRKYFL